MKAIVVDDEAIMLRSFERQSREIEGLSIKGFFQFPEEALKYAGENPVDLAILDIKMPDMNGLELAAELRKIKKDILIVFISAYDEFIRESNEINVDYYILKPYTRQTILQMVRRMQSLSLAQRQKKPVYMKMFGRFTVFYKEQPLPLVGKAKEVLALVATRRGREISNEEIYSTIWEDRPYSNVQMKVYYNALKRLRVALGEAGIENLLVSTRRGQILNTDLADCDYYAWLDQNADQHEKFNGEFLTEYSWGEYILAGMLDREEHH